MARKKKSRVEELIRKPWAHGQYKDPLKGAKAKEKTLFERIRQGKIKL